MSPRLPMLEVSARTLYWVILAASLWILLRGHDEPGGGFIGGLVAVAASVIAAVAFGSDVARRRLLFGAPLPLLASGVLLAAASGLPALLAGEPYLTHLWLRPFGADGPALSTVLLFDVGVYLCVWGSIGGYALALIAIDEAPR
jgi:multicomponent Na+:H+ antiporter subunit B